MACQRAIPSEQDRTGARRGFLTNSRHLRTTTAVRRPAGRAGPRFSRFMAPKGGLSGVVRLPCFRPARALGSTSSRSRDPKRRHPGMEANRKLGRRPREERTQDICAAARVAFAQSGYEGAIMADIASAAGIAEGTVYKMFASKRELLYTVMADWYGSFTRDLVRQLAACEGPAQKLRHLVWHHLSIIEADPALCRVFFREVRVLDDYRGSPVFELNREYTAHVTRVLEEGVERGVFRDDLPLPLLRDTVFGGLEHYAWPFLAGQRPLDVAGATDAFCRLLLAGIARAPVEATAEARLSRLADRVEAAVSRLERLPV